MSDILQTPTPAASHELVGDPARLAVWITETTLALDAVADLMQRLSRRLDGLSARLDALENRAVYQPGVRW